MTYFDQISWNNLNWKLLLVGIVSLMISSCSPVNDMPVKGVGGKNTTACFYRGSGSLCMHTKETADSVDQYFQINALEPVTIANNAYFSNLQGHFKPFSRCFLGTHTVPTLHMKKPKPGENKEDGWWEYKGRFNYHVGCKTRQHDDKVIYDLPYPRGQKYKVIQSDHGIKSHSDELDYAYDWQMPEGSPVHAARSGTVIDTFDRLAEWDEKAPSSYVYVSHSDGTVGQYRNLKYKGCVVKKGQKINKGDLLGLSREFLHFHVSTPTPGDTFAFKTFPLRFHTQEGVTELEHGRWYQNPTCVQGN